jgi:hypothetical protein
MKPWTFMLGFALSALTVGKCSQPAQAQTQYYIVVNTTILSGQDGNLDLQFNPGGLDALDATASITDVTTDGALAITAADTGGATGALPGSASIENSTSYNDLYQGLTFGDTLAFDVTFTGAAISPAIPLPSSGSAFAVSFYDAAGAAPLLTTDPSGAITEIDLNPNGSTTVQNVGEAGIVSASPVSSPSEVPEPSAVTVFALACLSTLKLTARVYRKRRVFVYGEPASALITAVRS